MASCLCFPSLESSTQTSRSHGRLEVVSRSSPLQCEQHFSNDSLSYRLRSESVCFLTTANFHRADTKSFMSSGITALAYVFHHTEKVNLQALQTFRAMIFFSERRAENLEVAHCSKRVEKSRFGDRNLTSRPTTPKSRFVPICPEPHQRPADSLYFS